jgi:D-glucosaminate-6-phosphate ammonia-lyase
VREIINASGATTAVGGTLMLPEVVDAMVDASRSFVVIEELNARVGEAIASATGAEAGYVTSGSASGMLLAIAACVTGTNRAAARRLPDTSGLPNEVVIHRAHRIGYDQMFRAPGTTFVEIGMPSRTEPWELEEAISDRTAAVAYVDSASVATGALDFDRIVEIAHHHNIPVVVDAASTLPPVGHLTRWISSGADLVIYSGGKGLRGPQDSGMLAGRKDLIDAAAMNGSPNAGIGRGMKTSKEAISGLYVALEWFLSHDHEREFQEKREQANVLRAKFESRLDTKCRLLADQEIYPSPILTVSPVDDLWDVETVHQRLKDGTPSIHCKEPKGGIEINMHCLFPGDPELVYDRFASILEGDSE